MKKLLLLVSIAACGGESGGGGADGPAPDAANVQPLTCQSIALCTTYDVKTFIGTVPEPVGGTVRDGLYRLAWAMDPTLTGDTPGYHEDLDALLIRGNQYNWAGFFKDDIGTFSTSGTAITFQATKNCSRGTDEDASTYKRDYKFTATASELHIYSHVSRSDGKEWDRQYVYKLTGSPQEVCTTVNSEPASPADSADCNVTNCACRFAVEGTVNACT